jgi:protein TonB
MLADSLCDSPWENRSHRGWTTLASFAMQAVAVASLLLLPLIYTSGLPQIQSMAALVAPAPPPAPPRPATHMPVANPPESNLAANGRFMSPQFIPRTIEQTTEAVPPPAPELGGPGVRGGTGDRLASNSVFDSLGNGFSLVAPPLPPAARPPRVSVMMQGNLIRQVQPEYPMLAKMAHVQGSVVLRAIISKEGLIRDLQVVSGPALLVPAAKSAVSRWRYRPYYLNHEPVEVETQVTVQFVLGG